MTIYSFGDVILVPFPFTDQSQAKQRPAVVVSSARYNTERPDLILMAITSQVRSPTVACFVIGRLRLAFLPMHIMPSALFPSWDELISGSQGTVLGGS